MSQRVPSCDAEPSTPSGHPRGQQQPSAPHTRMQSPDYEVAELTWKNGHLAMFGHRQPRVGKPIPRYASPASWDKPSAGDTLESLVDQATRAAQSPTPAGYENGKGISVAALDALVPCSSRRPHGEDHSGCVPDLVSGLSGTCVGSCSGRKRPKVGLWEAKYSASGSAAASMALTFDTCEINGGDEVGFATSANPVEESRETENTSSAKLLTVGEDRVSVCPSMDDGSHSHRDGCDKEEKTITMAKSSRKASVHNQSERKRRDRINQKMETLQKLVPNSSKTDKASMLDEVIEYLKQLQAQVQMMSRMNSSIPHMMMPMHVQQFQLSLMAQMAQMAQMGMGMRMGMVDMNSFTRPGNSGMLPFLQPSPFVPFPATWDGSGDRLPTSGGMALPTPAGTVLPDPLSSFMACQTQPISLEAYNRTASSYQQMFHQLPASNPKS